MQLRIDTRLTRRGQPAPAPQVFFCFLLGLTISLVATELTAPVVAYILAGVFYIAIQLMINYRVDNHSAARHGRFKYNFRSINRVVAMACFCVGWFACFFGLSRVLISDAAFYVMVVYGVGIMLYGADRILGSRG